MKFIQPNKDAWHALGGEDGPPVSITPQPGLLLDVNQWHAVRAHWPSGVAVGLKLTNDFEIEEIASETHRFALIALHFPKWVDGRAYSQARLLRSRYRYAGELRATGDVVVDMLPLLQRTGFDAVALRADQSVEVAQRALDFFSGHYQGDARDNRPLFAMPAGTAQSLANARHDFVNEGASI